MNEHVEIVPHSVKRIIIDVRQSFHELRERYERAVPKFDQSGILDMVLSGVQWQSVVAATNFAAPHGFVRFWSMDVTPVMLVAGHTGNCIEYLMGNHAIAERMYRRDRAVMLYAPLRALIYTSVSGVTKFALDQPSTLFGSFSDDAIAQVGRDLDRKLAQLLLALNVAVPDVLVESVQHESA